MYSCPCANCKWLSLQAHQLLQVDKWVRKLCKSGDYLIRI